MAADTKADVTVQWVGGKAETFRNVAANQWVTIRQGKGIVKTLHLQAAKPQSSLAVPLWESPPFIHKVALPL